MLVLLYCCRKSTITDPESISIRHEVALKLVLTSIKNSAGPQDRFSDSFITSYMPSHTKHVQMKELDVKENPERLLQRKVKDLNKVKQQHTSSSCEEANTHACVQTFTPDGFL